MCVSLSLRSFYVILANDYDWHINSMNHFGGTASIVSGAGDKVYVKDNNVWGGQQSFYNYGGEVYLPDNEVVGGKQVLWDLHAKHITK